MKKAISLYGLALVALLVGCSPVARYPLAPGVPEVASVQGSLTYQQATLLPAKAMVTVALSEVAQPSAPARLLSQITFLAAGQQAPIHFNLPYTLAQVAPHQRMLLYARIDVEGQPWFHSKDHYVITPNERGNPVTLQLITADRMR